MPVRRPLTVAAVALAAAALSAPAFPVSALEQEQGLRVEENQTVEQEYPPIPGQNPIPTPPAPARNFNHPDDCRTVAWCDVIPLEVVLPPTLGEADEFFVTVELSWETDRIPEGPEVLPGRGPVTSETAVNDLDLYVWDDPQGDEFVEAAASLDVPEVLRLWRPTEGRYQIVVHNYLGPNTGYRLKVSYEPEIIEAPFELLEPDFDFPLLPVEEWVPPLPPTDLSGLSPAPLPEGVPVTAPEVSPAPAPPPAPSLDPVPVEVDPDFAGFADSEFEDALAAPPQSDVLRERQARAVGPPPPASPAALIFWLAVVPLGLAAGAGVWLARRGSAVLRLR